MRYYEYIAELGFNQPDHFPGLPTGHCDWKDWWGAHDSTLPLLEHHGIQLDISRFGHQHGNSSDCGTGQFFRDLDHALRPLGYEVAQLWCGYGDCYFFTICDYNPNFSSPTMHCISGEDEEEPCDEWRDL